MSATPIQFVSEAKLPGNVTLEGPGKDSMRIWLGSSMGTVASGAYKDTQIIATGSGLGIYVKRDGQSVGTILLELGNIVVAAIAEFERIEKENS